ncbi:MAG: menaquinone biosynthetic enzyme MqnA/MqnD family protein, partial [Sphingobacteriales bacterium]
MDSIIRIAAVSYLNTLPLIYGIEHSPIIGKVELKSDYPSKIAQWLIDGEVDIGLVPVAIIPQLPVSYIVSDYCIGADGAVSSVGMFSEVPVEEIKTVILDYQSRTSNELVKLLLKNYWKISPDIIYSQKEYRHQITGTTAGVVIGDRAFEQKAVSAYEYDLAETWKLLTGLPFVFAAWVSNKPLTDDFMREFNEANALGLQSLSDVIDGIENKPAIDLDNYFTKNIQYKL